MTLMFTQHIVVAMLAGGAQMLSVQVVDRLWLPIPGVEVRVAAVTSCAAPKPTGEAKSGTTGKNGEVQLPAAGGMLLLTANIEGFERREECIELGSTVAGELLKVQLRLRSDVSNVKTTHSMPRPVARRGDPMSLRLLDFVGVYQDRAGASYYVSYSEQADALALDLPTGAIIHFRERDGLIFRSPQGVLSFRLENGRLAGLSYAPTTIRAEWVKVDR